MANAFKVQQQQKKKQQMIDKLVQGANTGQVGRMRAILDYAKQANVTKEQAENVLREHSPKSMPKWHF